ncbi:MAG: hypothetical protein WBG98_18345, partial [Brucella anthropi]
MDNLLFIAKCNLAIMTGNAHSNAARHGKNTLSIFMKTVADALQSLPRPEFWSLCCATFQGGKNV